MNRNTKNILVTLAVLGVIAYFVFPGALVGETITVTFTGKNSAPISGAICYINDQNSRTTNSAGVATFTLAREGRTGAGCICPGTNTRIEVSSYGTAIAINDPNCATSGGGGDTCTDSDGGEDIYEKGITCKSGVCKTDYCVDSSWTDNIPTVKEGYCSEYYGLTLVEDHCPSGYVCSDGACKNPNVVTTQAQPTTTKKITTTRKASGGGGTTLPDDDEEQNQTILIVGLGAVLVGLAYFGGKR